MSGIEKTVYATLDDLARKRRIVTKAIRDIAMIYGVDVRPWLEDETPATKPATGLKVFDRTKAKRAPKAKRAAKPKPQRPQSAPSGEGILATLKQHGPLSPGDLQHRLGLDKRDGCARVKALVAIGKVTVSGTTRNRRIALVP